MQQRYDKLMQPVCIHLISKSWKPSIAPAVRNGSQLHISTYITGSNNSESPSDFKSGCSISVYEK